MATVVKTLRIDEEFIKIIEEYNSINKEIFGVAPTVNSILTGTVVKGFSENLDVFKALQIATFPNPEDGAKFTDELKSKMQSLIQKYEEYAFFFEDREV